MSVSFGSTNIGEVYYGNTKISEMYYGNTLVYTSAGVPINYIYRDIDASGNITQATGALPSMGSQVTKIGDYGLSCGFCGCSGLTGTVDLSNIITLSGRLAMEDCFYNCTNLTSIDLSGLTTISGVGAMHLCFADCTNLTSIDLSSLTTVSSNYAMRYCFDNCTSLTSVNLNGLTTLSDSGAMEGCFSSCTALTAVTLGNTAAIDFGSHTNQFTDMFVDCTQNISVTAPAASRTVIEAMNGYPNFSGTGIVTWTWR